MIWFYSGTPGSGKSLHVAKEIYWKMRTGHCVIANFPINMEVFKYSGGRKTHNKGTCIQLENRMLNPEFLQNYARAFFERNKKGYIVEGQALIVIDECQLIFNSRTWQSNGRYEWISFFTQHRKFGYDIILVSQFDRLIDRQIRSLIEYEVIHRKINNFKIAGAIIGLLMGGSAFIAITYWYGAKQKISSDVFRLKKRYAEFYNSYWLF